MTPLTRSAFEATDSRLAVHQRLAALIEDAIEGCELNPGDPLPAESMLADEFDMALGTVRRAMDSLREKGLIERIQGKGTFVRRPNFAQSMMRFFRFGHEGDEQPDGRVLACNVVSADAETAAALELPAGAAVIELDRLRLMGGRVATHETIWLPRDRFATMADLAPETFPSLLYPWYQERFGVLVAHAREELTFGSATESDREVLGCEPEAPIAIITRVATNLRHQPIERRISHGLAATFNYRVEIL